MANAYRFAVVFNRIPELIAVTIANSKRAEIAGARKIAEEARRRAPVDTGELRDSIAAHDNEVIVGAEHGIYNEFGTYKMAPQPFFLPAIEAVAPEFFQEVGAGITY